MIQRIQTVFLCLAIICLGLTFFFPVAMIHAGDQQVVFNNYGLVQNVDGKWVLIGKSIPLYAAISLIMLLQVLTIMQFKRRPRQVMLCRVTYFLLLVLMALYFYLPDKAAESIKNGLNNTVTQGVSFFMPIGALVFTFLAERFIRKDEKLVRSADRLR